MKTTLLILIMLVLSVVGFAQKTQTMTIKVFLSNENLNPNMDDCNKVFPVSRNG